MREYSFDQSDVIIGTFRTGSMLNVADHAVTVTHIPTGLQFVEDAPIGQHRNRAEAFRKLDEALRERNLHDNVSPKPVTKENSHVQDQNDQG